MTNARTRRDRISTSSRCSQSECSEEGQSSHHHHHRCPQQNRVATSRCILKREVCIQHHQFFFFCVVMACISGVSSTLPAITMILRRRSITPFCTKLLLSSQHFDAPCCFSSLQLSSVNATPQKYFAAALHAKPNGQQSKSYTQRQPQQHTQRSRMTPQSTQTRQHSTRSRAPKLERPEVIFSNNHLLVVNKPAGWKSQPGNGGGKNNMQDSSGPDPKCLLTYLQSQSLGGGSMKDFLIPTHRLDQPCTGALIFAKNGKAASRVQVAWSKRHVKKCYWVIVEGGSVGKELDGLEMLRSRSMPMNGAGSSGNKYTYQLSAILKSTGGKGRNTKGGRPNSPGGSVMVKPVPPNHSSSDTTSDGNGRVCHIEWEHLLQLPAKASSSGTRHLLSVTTDTGAKHQVRALLALAGGTPIAGDLRYGNSNNPQNYNDSRQGRVDKPLPDGSVALHARSVFLPTVSLGGMEFLKDDPFVASIPKRWKNFFGITEDDVRRF